MYFWGITTLQPFTIGARANLYAVVRRFDLIDVLLKCSFWS
jgi:hypothetical protein